VPSAIRFDFINLLDLDADTDLDVGGAGFSNNSLSLSERANEARYHLGASAPQELVRGLFRTGASGQATLRTQTTAANVFIDPAGPGNGLAAESALAGLTEGQTTVQIGTVVEGTKTLGLGNAGNGGTSIPLTITGSNGRYISSTFSAAAGQNVVKGTANLAAIGTGEGPVLVMLRFSDTDPAAGPAIADVMGGLSGSDGSTPTRIAANDPMFVELAKHYPFLLDTNAALFSIAGDSDRILNFDFTGQGGIGVDRLAAVPEPGVIGALSMVGFGLLARRRRNA
jgi:hypothetical protein